MFVKPGNILLAGRLRKETAEYLASKDNSLQFKLREYEEIKQDDVAWADVYMGFFPPEQVRLAGIKWVHAMGAGVDFYIFRHEWPKDVLLTRTRGDFGNRIGEYCIARALAATQNIPELFKAQQRHEWNRKEPGLLQGSRVLVVGAGEVGQGIAKKFIALGCEVHGVSIDGAPLAPFAKVFSGAEMDEPLAWTDWLIVSLPLTEDTYLMFDKKMFDRCQGAYLINVGRGKLIDEDALVEALRNGRLRGAALDVFFKEPLPPDSPLWDEPKVLISAHIAAITTAREAGDSFLLCMEQLQQGQRPDLTVNVEQGF